MIFKPKHQRLIDQCYPPGKNVDKRPNNAELSYLLFYATTRRIKLEKVGKYLELKTLHDTRRIRSGNVQVTLEILNQLVLKTSENISVFLENALSILQHALALKELALSGHCTQVFESLCSNLDTSILSGDKKILDQFVSLSHTFLNLHSRSLSQVDHADWAKLSIQCCRHLSVCLSQSSQLSSSLTPNCMELIVNQVEALETGKADLFRFVSRTSSSRVPVWNSESQDSLEAETMQSLKSYFDLNSAAQIRISTQSVTNNLCKREKLPHWGSILLECIVSWCPVQLRVVMVSAIMKSLAKYNTEPDTTKQQHACEILSQLLGSSTTIVGLPVLDELRTLISFQTQKLYSPQLVKSYTQAIDSLARHIYYKDQLNDMVGEISFRWRSFYTEDGSTEEKFLHATTCMLADAECIIGGFEGDSANNSDLSLDAFMDMVELVMEINSSSHPEVFIKSINVRILNLFERYLQMNQGSPNGKTDFSGYATNPASPLKRIIEMFDAVLNHPFNEQDVALQVLRLLDLLLQTYGANFVATFLGFYDKWQNDNVVKKNVFLQVVFLSAKFLDLSALQQDCQAKISSLKGMNQWVVPVDTDTPNGSTIDGDTSNSYSALELASYFTGNHSFNHVYQKQVQFGVDTLNGKATNGALNGIAHRHTGSSIELHRIHSFGMASRSVASSSKFYTPSLHDLKRTVFDGQQPKSVDDQDDRRTLKSMVETLNIDDLI